MMITRRRTPDSQDFKHRRSPLRCITLSIAGLCLSSALVSTSARAEHGHHAAPEGDQASEGTDSAPHDGAAHEATGHEATGHEAAHGEHHVPHFSDINWFHGMVAEKEGAQPSLLWRPVGMPVPLGALLLNSAILFYLIVHFGGPGIRQGLRDRKQRIAGDIERAAQMRAEAVVQLAHYETKLAAMESEMASIKQKMTEQAQADRERLLADAKERRIAIEADAHLLIEQELAQARQDATLRLVSSAVAAARAQVSSQVTEQDQARLAHEFLGNLQLEVNKSTGVGS